MFSNEICWLAGNARPFASDQLAQNPISARLAMPVIGSSPFERQACRFESFRKLGTVRQILFLHISLHRNEGSLEAPPCQRTERFLRTTRARVRDLLPISAKHYAIAREVFGTA